MAKISLQNRKRTGELSDTVNRLNQTKKDELLALKLHSLNEEAKSAGKLLEISIDAIHPDPHQPRKTFKNIEGLARSIQEQGLLQPIIVKTLQNSEYQIIVGERRFHAAKQAGLQKVPAILREEEDAQTLILQLLENDQRERVSPLEEAEALQKLIEQMKLSKQDIAKELGRDSAWVSLRLGLLNANPQIKTLIQEEKVQDLRTLHELRKLSEEEPELFESAIRRINALDFSGGYRNLIREVRQNHKEQGLPRVLKAEYKAGALSLYIQGKRKPLQFEVDQVVLNSLRNLLS